MGEIIPFPKRRKAKHSPVLYTPTAINKLPCPRCQEPVAIGFEQCPYCGVHYAEPLGDEIQFRPLPRWRKNVIWLVLYGLALPFFLGAAFFYFYH